jgi:4-carboxymuconolactone decarboxylase
MRATVLVGAGDVRIADVSDACLIDVVTQLLPFVGYPRALNGLRAIDEVAPAYETNHS